MNAKKGTLLITAQMVRLLEQIEPDVYTQSLDLFNGSSLGQHFRHILEFYTCLFEGAIFGTVDYSRRKRNQILNENPKAAAATLEYIAHVVETMEEQRQLMIRSEFSDETMPDAEKPCYPSSVGRELQYAFDHAIHHLATIRMGLETNFPHIQIEKDLGMAPSTLKFQKTTSASVIPETTYG